MGFHRLCRGASCEADLGPKNMVHDRKFAAMKAYPFGKDKVAQARSRRSDVEYIKGHISHREAPGRGKARRVSH